MSSPRSARIRTPLVGPLLQVLRAAGGDADELIREQRLPAEIESLAEAAVPLRSLAAVFDAVAERVNDPCLGLHLAMSLPRGQFGVMEFILRSVATIRDGFRLAARYSSLINDLTEVRFEEDDQEARLSERIPIDPSGPGRHSNELVIAVAVRLIREGCRTEWKPKRVWFAHAAHAERAALAAYFGTGDIVFDAGWNGFAIPRADLDLPLVSSNAALLSVLETQARGVLARYPSKGEMMPRIREAVRLCLVDGVSLGSVAAKLTVTPRELQRHLASEGQGFHEVVERVREDLARHYIGDPELSLVEIAFLLGYSDQRAFLRAFKRWTGTTPGKLRQSG